MNLLICSCGGPIHEVHQRYEIDERQPERAGETGWRVTRECGTCGAYTSTILPDPTQLAASNG